MKINIYFSGSNEPAHAECIIKSKEIAMDIENIMQLTLCILINYTQIVIYDHNIIRLI